ncbi:MAG TPA: hypothetical protein VI934_04355 [Candidatus Nanoarchaeia archaeon]|nr:hypothetical protein [Candidatus Nanoarchaeia archaeon]
MFSSQTSHYLRHVFIAYGQQGGRLKGKMIVLEQLQQLEAECLKLQKRHNDSPKLQATLERIKSIKASL